MRRQLWVLLFDGQGRQLPLLVPVDIPPRPDPDDVEGFAGFLDSVVGLASAVETAIVYERPGGAALTAADRAWIGFLAEVRWRCPAWRRPLVLVHARGARLVDDGEGDGIAPR